jgi:DNA-binding transcriptional MerR regulator
MDEKPHFSSGELAGLAGISPDTLRHYERMKLLAPPRRSSGNYRQYPPAALNRVRLIRHALAVGFSLPELARILKVRDKGGAPCRQAKQLLESKLHAMDAQIEDLVSMRNHLRTILADWEARLAHTLEGERAGLLESLVVPPHLLKPLKVKEKMK